MRFDYCCFFLRLITIKIAIRAKITTKPAIIKNPKFDRIAIAALGLWKVTAKAAAGILSELLKNMFVANTFSVLALYRIMYMGFSDLVGRFIAHNYGVPCGAMVFVLYPDFVIS